MKIISIIHFPSDYKRLKKVTPTKKWELKNGKFAAIWDGNWSQRLGNRIISDDDIQFEVWRPDLFADSIKTHTYLNGLVYKLFPAEDVLYFYGLRRKKIAFSKEMFDELNNEMREGNKVILHLNASYRKHDELLMNKFRGKIPIVGQFYTNPQTLFDKSSTYNPLKLLHRLIIKEQIRNYIRKIDYIIPSTEENLQHIRSITKAHIFLRDNHANFGFDFEKGLDDDSLRNARKALSISSSEHVFLLSSRLVPEKQIDKFLFAFHEMNNYLNVNVYITGYGNEEYVLYLRSIIEKLNLTKIVKLIGYVSDEQLLNYYKACDTFINCSINEAGPMSSLMAAYYGKTIVTTNTGLVYEFLNKHNYAYILDRNLDVGWSKILDKAFLKGKPQNHKELEIEDFVSWNRIIDYYRELFRKVESEFYIK